MDKSYLLSRRRRRFSYFLLFLGSGLVFCTSAFAQEELLGKSFKEALAYIRTYKTNDGTYRSDYSDTLPVFGISGECAKQLTLSRLEFQKWDNWASLDICADSTDHVSNIGIGFHAAFKEIVMSSHDRKIAVRELTKKFGKPKFTKKDGEEMWIWMDTIGTYEFIHDLYSGACDFGAELGQHDHGF